MKQVHDHRESQINQYHLVQRAEAFGWPRDRIQVIDKDQGLSGQGSDYRQGFKDLVAEVSLGRVGIIFGYEVSRLARNNSDWYHLLDLAAMFETLIADNDGLYDPRLYNDRLLLGLKGTMSEAELHLLRSRLDAGRLSQVRRGEYRHHLPTGLMRLPDGTVIKDPDDQIRHVIELVFTQFETLGSCRQVLRYFCQHNILLPRRQTAGLHKSEVLWKPATDAALYDILHNPAYAGAFAYGRKQSDPIRRHSECPTTKPRTKPMTEWLHLQQGVYPSYITWAQYLTNQERLHQNATQYTQHTQRAQGAVREGTALLQGLITCGRCGHHMRVAYKHSFRYFCNAVAKHMDGPICMSLHGLTLDQVVVQAFFDALRPSHLDTLKEILTAQHTEHKRLAQLWQDRVQRVRYSAQLAERQYQAVDPDNRLVAAELERRWEEALRQLQTTQQAWEQFQQTPSPANLSQDLRQKFQHIAETLPMLWPTLTPSQQKDLLRSLIARVIVQREAPDRIAVRIVWISGHYSLLYAQPPIHRQQDVSGYQEMVARIHELWHQGLNDLQMAAHLKAEGFHSAHGQTISAKTVLKIRRHQGLPMLLGQSRNAVMVQDRLTPRGLASQIGVERSWVYRRIAKGVIAPAYVTQDPNSGIYLIKDDPALIDHLRGLAPQSSQSNMPRERRRKDLYRLTTTAGCSGTRMTRWGHRIPMVIRRTQKERENKVSTTRGNKHCPFTRKDISTNRGCPNKTLDRVIEFSDILFVATGDLPVQTISRRRHFYE